MVLAAGEEVVELLEPPEGATIGERLKVSFCFGSQVSGFGVRCLRSQVSGLNGSQVLGFWCQVSGVGFRVSGFGSTLYALGFRV